MNPYDLITIFQDIAKTLSDIKHRISKRKSWSQSGNLITGQTNQNVSMQASVEPGLYTLQFGIIDPPPDNGGTPSYDAQATVTWTNNGVPNTRVVDIGRGTCISGLCDAVGVVVKDNSTVTVIPAPGGNNPFAATGKASTAGLQYEVSISLTKGMRPSFTSDPILRAWPTGTTLNAGASGIIQIPTNSGAKGVKLYTNPNTPQSVLLEFFGSYQGDNQAGPLATIDPTTIPSGTNIWFPPESANLKIINNSGGPITFTLEWVIDG